ELVRRGGELLEEGRAAKDQRQRGERDRGADDEGERSMEAKPRRRVQPVHRPPPLRLAETGHDRRADLTADAPEPGADRNRRAEIVGLERQTTGTPLSSIARRWRAGDCRSGAGVEMTDAA